MESFEIIAPVVVALLDAVAWPVAVVIIAFLFRKQLRGVVKRLSKLRYMGIQADFEKELGAAEKTARASAIPQVGGQRPLDVGSSLEQDIERFMRVAEVHPQAAIVGAWPTVEEAALRASQRLNLPLPERFPNYQVMRVLVDKGAVDHEIEVLYNRLRRLRNKAAHAHNFEIDADEAERYLRLTIGLSNYLNSISAE